MAARLPDTGWLSSSMHYEHLVWRPLSLHGRLRHLSAGMGTALPILLSSGPPCEEAGGLYPSSLGPGAPPPKPISHHYIQGWSHEGKRDLENACHLATLLPGHIAQLLRMPVATYGNK